MQSRHTRWLIPIALVLAAAIYVVWPNTGIHFTLGTTEINQDFKVYQGLDLQGGLQILLEADIPLSATVGAEAMSVVRTIVEQRVNSLGLTEPLVQIQGNRRLVVELPGARDPQQAVDIIKETGLLEFVYAGSNFLPSQTVVQTDCLDPSKVDCGNANGPLGPTVLTNTTTATGTTTVRLYHTVMTGVAIKSATVSTQNGQVTVDFELTDDGSRIFSTFTSQYVGDILAIVLDKAVVSSPRINQAITGGRGSISGSFDVTGANQLAIQLRYGSLPVPLKVIRSREVGPTLGQDSVRKSTLAGIIGLSVVALFMLLYYRLPGAVATVALLIYAVITFALFKLIPVTLTLPGIAGFILSVGVAVDANILIFERMKEELRAGRNLQSAVSAGFNRAWPSIRDSNISTLITCGILYWFGNAFGASIVKGFAITLALGVGVSLFTAILVTRTILHLFLDRVDFSQRHSWFGI